MFSVSVNLDSRVTAQTLFLMMLKGMRFDKSIIHHIVLTQCPFVTQQDELLEVCL
jgi:hypothetical protein